jgi:hypothetical protein
LVQYSVFWGELFDGSPRLALGGDASAAVYGMMTTCGTVASMPLLSITVSRTW